MVYIATSLQSWESTSFHTSSPSFCRCQVHCSFLTGVHWDSLDVPHSLVAVCSFTVANTASLSGSLQDCTTSPICEFLALLFLLLFFFLKSQTCLPLRRKFFFHLCFEYSLILYPLDNWLVLQQWTLKPWAWLPVLGIRQERAHYQESGHFLAWLLPLSSGTLAGQCQVWDGSFSGLGFRFLLVTPNYKEGNKEGLFSVKTSLFPIVSFLWKWFHRNPSRPS